MKIAYVTNLWGKYYGHFLLERTIQKYSNVNLDIYFCAYSEKNRHYTIKVPKSDLYYASHLKGEVSWGIDKHFNFEIIPLVLKNKYDLYLIGGYSYPTVALAIILSRLFKRKYILLIDHMYRKSDRKEWFRNIIKKFLIRGANAYITTSEESKGNLVYYGASQNKIFIALLSCSDFFYLDNQNTDKNFQKPFEKYILFIGRFEEYKGIKYLLNAFKIVKSKIPDINLVLIGSGSLEQDIQVFIKENNFSKSIKIYNWLSYEELPPYYRNALMMICPSTHEPWAFVVNEAMASGLPVIASSAVGAARALIKNNENGFIVPPQDSQAIADKITTLLNDENLRKRISQNAYRTVKQYTIGKISDIYYKVFNFVIKQK